MIANKTRIPEAVRERALMFVHGSDELIKGLLESSEAEYRPRYETKATALAASAPEKPATSEVHPLRNPNRGPKARERYTYSPPASGHSLPNSEYVTAPANANSPPTNHSATIAPGCGTMDAMIAGVVKMPTPITFETTSAVASTRPSLGA